jgi:hypothetical protein
MSVEQPSLARASMLVFLFSVIRSLIGGLRASSLSSASLPLDPASMAPLLCVALIPWLWLLVHVPRCLTRSALSSRIFAPLPFPCFLSALLDLGCLVQFISIVFSPFLGYLAPHCLTRYALSSRIFTPLPSLSLIAAGSRLPHAVGLRYVPTLLGLPCSWFSSHPALSVLAPFLFTSV